ncbi:peptidoglycan DD-metalloendopeptidase family protein [Leucobacter soli]|uniref:peptidoglycan DD-metalloendopeptidase family protein n=2 Tax=Leucobacter soli TaxID=2812850 RepID=UPI003610D2B1
MRDTKSSRIRRISMSLVVVGAMVALIFSNPGGSSTAAHAVDLPTWDDVQAAKQNEATAVAKVQEIEQLIAQSEAELQRLRTATETANAKWQEAETAAEEAAQRAQELETEASASQEEAREASDQASDIISQLYRSGGVDYSTEVFFQADAETTDALLNRLAMMERATQRNSTMAERAQLALNTAASLGEQAEVAQEARDQLASEAEAMAQTAAQNLDDQRAEFLQQEAQQQELQAQLAALKDATTTTVTGYEERLRIEEEQRRNQQAAGGGGGGGGGTPGGSGWYQPVPISWISTYFRQPWSHTGLDLPAGCGTPIVAPASGTVVVAGWVDNFGGYMTYLNQDNGYQTRFAHQIGTPPVSYGQWVPAGAVIGYVGNTGMSFGCHVHYEVLSGGSFVDPTPFI